MTNAKDENVTSSHDATNALDASVGGTASDAQLLRSIQMGDSTAWQELYQRYFPSAWRFAWQLVGDRQVAEDLVAESLLALCRKASQLDPESTKLFGWLRGVIRHKAMDHHRAKARKTAAMDQRDHRRTLNGPSKPRMSWSFSTTWTKPNANVWNGNILTN